MATAPVLLTIAGFDPSGGAGVTADLQVFAAHGMFGTAAITALTVQSTRGVRAVEPVAPEVLSATLTELQADLPPLGIKIGMLGSKGVVGAVADFLETLQALPDRPVVVLDPVLRSSSGCGLLEVDALEILQARLLPLVDWLTPNWAELGVLAGVALAEEREATAALHLLGERLPALGLIATGGDRAEPFDLLRLPNGRLERITGEHVETTSTHGTGCAFSSALLCGLIGGAAPAEAARAAKRYVEGALRHAPGVGSGRGPMGLLWPLRHAATLRPDAG